MFDNFKTKFNAFWHSKIDPKTFAMNNVLMAAMVTMLLMSLPTDAMAQFQVPFIDQFGCQVVKWMKGPLAILIFVVVVVATLVVGMIAKMDWGRIIQICVVFGIITGLGSLLANSSIVQGSSTIASCLN